MYTVEMLMQENIWNDVIVAKFRTLSWHFKGKTEENHVYITVRTAHGQTEVVTRHLRIIVLFHTNTSMCFTFESNVR
jgi:hypothetical protein